MGLEELDHLQEEIATWRNHNFPTHTAWEQLLGVVEEVGEISHAEIKWAQGIRGSATEHERAAKDGVGDLLVFLMGYAQKRGWTISECLLTSWEEVRQRDWVKYPGNGLPPEPEHA